MFFHLLSNPKFLLEVNIYTLMIVMVDFFLTWYFRRSIPSQVFYFLCAIGGFGGMILGFAVFRFRTFRGQGFLIRTSLCVVLDFIIIFVLMRVQLGVLWSGLAMIIPFML